MAKDNDVVNPEPTTEEQPTPVIEGKPAGQPYDPASDSGADLESLRAMIREEMQSVKDTRIGKSETRIDNLEIALAEYRSLVKGGMPEAQAEAKMLRDQDYQNLKSEIEALKSGKEAVAPSAGAGKQLLTEKQASILSGVGLTVSDPRFTQFLRDNPKFKTNEEYFEALDKQAIAWQSDDAKKPQPSGTSVAQTIPAVPSGDRSYTKEKYAEDMFANRGNKTKLNEIKAKAKADGVDVDNIGFNL